VLGCGRYQRSHQAYRRSVGARLDLDWFDSGYHFVGYFLLSQLLLIPVIYGFTRIDWHALFVEKRFRLLEKPE
jgi:hypothetical protein